MRGGAPRLSSESGHMTEISLAFLDRRRVRFPTLASATYRTATLAALAATALGASPQANVPPALPRCVEADVATLTRLDSAANVPGDAFAFRVTRTIAGGEASPDVPAGARGYGIVAFVDHAHGSGQPGRIVVEPRFIILPDGHHLPATADPQLDDAFVSGDSKNVNGALALVPGIGLVVSGYNALHRGREVTIPVGTPFRVVLGDALALGECAIPRATSPDVR
jgi:hypothetical protein